MCGYRKDHKFFPIEEADAGPDTRPVVNAKRGPISRFAHLLGLLVTIVAREADTEGRMCESPEEIMEALEELNKDAETNKDITAGSLDVKALYPSLIGSRTAEIVGNMVANSEIEFENIDFNELCKYIAINATNVEIESKGMTEFIHTRKSNRGPKPGMTSEEVTGGDQSRAAEKSKWNKPIAHPEDPARRKILLGWAVEIGIKTVFGNLFYKFDGKIRRQGKGGGIGDRLTEAVAKAVMVDWDKCFCLRAGRLGIQMLVYKRYVDDENVVMRSLEPGTRYDNTKDELVVEAEAVETDKNVPEDERNMKVLKDVADSVEPMIQTTIDYPSKHEDKKMPILDLKIWIDEHESGGREVQFEFYKKPFSSKYVMLATSAAPWQMKRTVLTQEGIRRLMMCKLSLPARRKSEILSQYMLMLKRSGYNDKFRLEIVKSVKNGFEKILEADRKGEKPMYRSKAWRKSKEMRVNKHSMKKSWYQVGGFNSVVFVPYTPGGVLAKTWRSTLERLMGGWAGGLKVVEQVGKSILTSDLIWQPDI